MANQSDEIIDSFAPLHTLASLITSSVAVLESECKGIKVPWPNLDEPTYVSRNGLSPHDLLRLRNEAIGRASATIIAATTQLLNVVREPALTVVQTGLSYHLSSALRVATELHIVDILRDSSTTGLHVSEIAKPLNVDPDKLARILRLLATHHIFTEVKPDVFANNRNSAVLEKGQSIEALLQNPSGKYDRPESALSALVSHHCDETFKSSSHLFETIVNPDTSFSGSPSKCPFSNSRDLIPHGDKTVQLDKDSGQQVGTADTHKSDPTIWDILTRPSADITCFGFENERLRRFGVAMEGVGKVLPVEEVLEGFDFASLSPGSVVVDVGGGVGSVSRILARKFENLNLVVQDRQEVCEEGVRRWKEAYPEALESGRVSFEQQDFFGPQPKLNPPRRPAVFLLKHILHDWSDSYCHTILQHLRDAAENSANTKLLVLDSIVPYACCLPGNAGDGSSAHALPGFLQATAEPPLLGNWGNASSLAYFADMVMLSILNGQERTLAHTQTLYRNAGWEVTKVTQSRSLGQVFSLVEARAI